MNSNEMKFNDCRADVNKNVLFTRLYIHIFWNVQWKTWINYIKVCKITSPNLTQLSVDNKTYVQIAAIGINVI